MEIVLNGKPRRIPDRASVEDLIVDLGFTGRNVVVERNGEPLERSRFAEVMIETGDRLEIVRPVQGG